MFLGCVAVTKERRVRKNKDSFEFCGELLRCLSAQTLAVNDYCIRLPYKQLAEESRYPDVAWMQLNIMDGSYKWTGPEKKGQKISPYVGLQKDMNDIGLPPPNSTSETHHKNCAADRIA